MRPGQDASSETTEVAGADYRRLTIVAALVLLSWAAVARPAEAQEEAPPSPEIAEARQHYAQGEALFEAENYEGALAELQRAYELLEGHPSRIGILYNIGQCYERLFRYDRALDYYRRYVESAGEDSEDVAEVRGITSALERLLATVRVRTNVEGAEIWVDERLVGEAPGDVLVPGGRHTIELRAPGYLPARREFQVAARSVIEQEVALEAVPEQTGLDPVWFWISGGAALASAAVGTGFGVHALELHSAAGGIDLDGMQQARVDDAALTADVLFGSVALFGATAIVLALLTQWSDPETPAATAVVAPSLGGAVMMVGGWF